MKKIGVALIVLIGVLGLAGAWIASQVMGSPPALEPGRENAVLSNVTLVEPGRGRREGRSLTLDGDRIGAIDAARDDARDPFAGATVLPGLNDLHIHYPPAAVPGQTELWSFLFLAHGVTGVRDAGDVDGTATGPAISGIATGDFPGPRIRSCGPFVDADPPLWANSIVVASPEEGRRAVAEIAERGHDCVKAYNGLDAPTLTAIREEARARALPVIGHVPRGMDYSEARLGDSQHLIGLLAPDPEEAPFPFNQSRWSELDDARIEVVIAESLARDLAMTPTLVTSERLSAYRSYETMLEAPDAQLVPRFYREVLWNPVGGVTPAGQMQAKDFDAVDRALEVKLRTVKRLHDAGVRLHSGTDTLVFFLVPGAALHREIRLFERAGLSPEQALAISTGASADALGVPGLGRLETGAPAELAIFREDPTRDLAALDTLIGVVRNGRLHTRAELDAQLERYRAHFGGPVYDAVTLGLVRQAVSASGPGG